MVVFVCVLRRVRKRQKFCARPLPVFRESLRQSLPFPLSIGLARLNAAEHSYLQTAKDLGGADEFAENWAAAIMQQLRAEVEQREPANTKLVKALHEDGPLPAESVREPAFDLTHFSRSKS